MMLRRNDRNLENIPVGALGLIALDGCTEMGAKVNDYLVKWLSLIHISEPTRRS